MITAINNKNSHLYKDLFVKASEVLSGFERTQTFDEEQTYYYKNYEDNSFDELVYKSTEKEDKIYEFADALEAFGQLYIKNGKNPLDYNFAPALGITTLEEYYNWLPELKADSKGNPTIFTKLPLDEAHFEINANTRAITIPADFKKNGIAVQGDDLAEVVYFMIDRYYDAMDLNNTDVYIEWEAPKGKGSAGPVRSISDVYLKMIDDENYPGKLIFGWAISDAITKESGTLKFSVRFVKWNDEREITYSFNTLTAQVSIQPSVGLNLEEDAYEVDNCNNRLLERIEPSEVVGGIKAAVPYFLKDIVLLDDGYDIEDNHTTGTYDLDVVATADDTGMIQYIWKRSEIGEDSWAEIPNSTTVKLVQLTEAEYDQFEWKLPEKRIFYTKREDDSAYLLPKGYYDLNDAKTKEYLKLEEGEIPELYEKRGVLTVEKYGEYKAEARNRIFNSLTKAVSKVALFKTPDPVELDNADQTPDKHFVGDVLRPVVKPAVGDLSFQWYRADETNSDVYQEIEDEITNDIIVLDPGLYKLKVVRTRNRATEENESIIYRVTNIPSAPPAWDENSFNVGKKIYVSDLIDRKTALSIGWVAEEADSFEVKWMLYRGDAGKADLEVARYQILDKNCRTDIFNPVDYEDKLLANGENVEGEYYAQVAIVLNGKTFDFTEVIDPANMFLVIGSVKDESKEEEEDVVVDSENDNSEVIIPDMDATGGESVESEDDNSEVIAPGTDTSGESVESENEVE